MMRKKKSQRTNNKNKKCQKANEINFDTHH